MDLETLARETVAALGGETLVRAANVTADEVWAVGKAACAMARGSGVGKGIIVTKHAEEVEGFAVYEAGHPIPDTRGVLATLQLLKRARDVTGHVLLLLSGGTSALLAAPVPGVSLPVLKHITGGLMDAGAPIGEINVVRRHLGLALGGKLAMATKAKLSVLALSDVVGDDPATIGSGPASADPSTLDDARKILQRHGFNEDILEGVPETPKKLDVPFRILASPLTLRDEAARRVTRARVREKLVQGPVEDIAAEIASIDLQPGEVWVAAGEPTVQVHGNGRGGRAQHLALMVARAIAGTDKQFVALGSDGSDGPTAAAGAVVDGRTWQPRGEDFLRRCDSHTFLSAAEATIVTGPTGTNLTDLLLLGRRA